MMKMASYANIPHIIAVVK